MKNEPTKLGQIIKKAREEFGLTVDELAERVDVTGRHISRIENEGAKPSLELLGKLIRELNIPADEIFDHELVFKGTKADIISRINWTLSEFDELYLNAIDAALRAFADKLNGRRE